MPTPYASIVFSHSTVELPSVCAFGDIFVIGDWFCYTGNDTIQRVYLK